jgi:predicted lipoprotein with Yx(FWY)xxD motif
LKTRSIATLATLLAAALLAACGSTSSSPGSTSTAAPTASVASPSPRPSTPQAAATTPVVATAIAMVAGNSATILTDTQGLTLYSRTSDSATNVCSGGCAGAWPPLLLPQGEPGSGTALPGTLAISSNINGRQVTYNGHPLYRFASDGGPGSTKGNGLLGVWFVATPGLA